MRISSFVGPESQSSLESDVFAYLATLPAKFFDRFYEHPATCLTVFRSLPNIAKLYIMRVLFLSSPIPMSVVQTWHRRESKKKHNQALRVLNRLHLLDESALPAVDGPVFSLRPQFKRHITYAIVGGSANSFGDIVPKKVNADALSTSIDIENTMYPSVTGAFLDQYAKQKIDAILHFMIGTSDADITPNVIALLLSAELLVEVPSAQREVEETTEAVSIPSDDEYTEGVQKRKKVQKQAATKRKEEATMLRITQRGFQFLLQNPSTQMWMLLLKYIEHAEAVEIDPCEALQFIFLLGCLSYGNAYYTRDLTLTQKQVLQELVHLGLVYTENDESIYYPTRLATKLTVMEDIAAASPSSSAESGFLMIETNYRVYAYTDSPIQIAILSLLCTMNYRFANVIVASITRESVHEAMQQGISGDQIIAYFYAHAHPQMKTKTPMLPPTVVDQIRLWEMERHRLKSSQAMVYHEFAQQRDYDAVKEYAEHMGILLLAQPDKKMIFAKPEGHASMRSFIKKHLAKRE